MNIMNIMNIMKNIKPNDIVIFEPCDSPKHTTIAVVVNHSRDDFWMFKTLISNTDAGIIDGELWSYNISDPEGFKLTNLGSKDKCPEYFL